MKAGKVPENVLKRSVLNQIKKRRAEVLVGPSIGEDCSVLQVEKDDLIVISTDPITASINDIGTLAVHITANDIASSGAEVIGIMLNILLPVNSKESDLKDIMKDIEKVCKELDIEVMGGHTEVTEAVNRIIVTVTGIGKVNKNEIINTAGAKVGDDIIITKWAGLEGTGIIASEKKNELLTRYAESFINNAIDFLNDISVIPESKIAKKIGATSMHDITEGGVFGALWEVGQASDVGIEVDISKIPLRQETIEICEFYDLNPYKLISSGCMLITSPLGNELEKALNEAGIKATLIGKVVKGNKKLVVKGDERRFLEPAKSDELYKVI